MRSKTHKSKKNSRCRFQPRIDMIATNKARALQPVASKNIENCSGYYQKTFENISIQNSAKDLKSLNRPRNWADLPLVPGRTILILIRGLSIVFSRHFQGSWMFFLKKGSNRMCMHWYQLLSGIVTRKINARYYSAHSQCIATPLLFLQSVPTHKHGAFIPITILSQAIQFPLSETEKNPSENVIVKQTLFVWEAQSSTNTCTHAHFPIRCIGC